MKKSPPSMMFKLADGRLVSREQLLRLASGQRTAALPPVQAGSAPAAVDDSDEAEPRDVEAIFDALVIAAAPHHKTWLVNYLNAIDHRSASGARLSAGAVAQALDRLIAEGRVVKPAMRHNTTQFYAAAGASVWPRFEALVLEGDANHLWKCLLWATQPSPQPPDQVTGYLPSRSAAEMAAVLRLLIHGRTTTQEYNRWVSGPLRSMTSPEAVLAAIQQPFMPRLFERVDAELRAGLVTLLDRIDPVGKSPAYNEWITSLMQHSPAEVPAPMRYRMAERCMNALDFGGMRRALAGLTDAPIVAMFDASEACALGRWAEAGNQFAVAYKALQTLLGQRRGIAPAGLTWIYPMALLAQPEPATWTLARKFCIAESGSRKPPADDYWGLWAHAAGVRIGDESLQANAFSNASVADLDYGGNEHSASKLMLAAWLGIKPAGWTPALVTRLLERLVTQRRLWLAHLVLLACERLGLRHDAPALPGTLMPAGFFGEAREAWRDALAAISALGDKPRAGNAAAATSTLDWQIDLDDEGRVADVSAFERSQSARGVGKRKLLTLLQLKARSGLDPRDAAVARCVEGTRFSHPPIAIDATAAALALVHHPAVYFGDAPAQRVDLSEGLPLLEVSRGKGGFGFRIDPPLVAKEPPPLSFATYRSNIEAEVERRNSLRIVRDAPDRARLIRITPAQRRVAELVAQDWSVPADAKAELESALKVLSAHFQLHSDAAAGREVNGESRLRAQLTPQGMGLQLRLVVMPFGSFGPSVTPGVGRERIITMHEGDSLATRRALADERAHWRSVMEALPALDDGSSPDAGWSLDDPEQALHMVEKLSTLPAILALDWPRGKAMRVTPMDSPSLGLKLRSGRDWFALEGNATVDETRVLGLQQLMQLAKASRSRYVALGDSEYLALSDRLRQQLADLDAAGKLDKDGALTLPAAAAAWLDGALEGATVDGDRAWMKRVAALAEAAALEPVAEGLQADLRGYQAEGFAWLVRLAHAGFGACLADDMGLGKTVQALALLLQRAPQGPALVLAPTSVCSNWVDEAMRFAPSLNARLYGPLDDAARDELVKNAAPYDVIVVSYALVHNDNARFAARPWATLVIDEAQALKNAATQRAKAVAALEAGFRVALTGTPVENHLGDLWSIMNLINPGLLGSANQFGERFGTPIEKLQDGAARQRLRRLVAPFLLRRTKGQVLQDLPPRTEIIHRVEPTPQERAFLEALRRTASERVEAMEDEGAGQSSFHVLAELTRLRRAACDPRLVAPELNIVGSKLQEFEIIVRELVEGQHKALVFSQFTDFLKLLAERLQTMGVTHQYLDGSTPAAERAKRVQAFQRGDGDLFLISLKAGGFGLNLTAADYVLIVDPWWNPAAEDQAMGRAHRMGQQRPVTVYRLVTAGSIEERIVALHRDKRSLADGILEGQENAAVMSAEVLREMLRGGG